MVLPLVVVASGVAFVVVVVVVVAAVAIVAVFGHTCHILFVLHSSTSNSYI